MNNTKKPKEKLSIKKELPKFSTDILEIQANLESTALELQQQLDEIEGAKNVDQETMKLEFSI